MYILFHGLTYTDRGHKPLSHVTLLTPLYII